MCVEFIRQQLNKMCVDMGETYFIETLLLLCFVTSHSKCECMFLSDPWFMLWPLYIHSRNMEGLCCTNCMAAGVNSCSGLVAITVVVIDWLRESLASQLPLSFQSVDSEIKAFVHVYLFILVFKKLLCYFFSGFFHTFNCLLAPSWAC